MFHCKIFVNIYLPPPVACQSPNAAFVPFPPCRKNERKKKKKKTREEEKKKKKKKKREREKKREKRGVDRQNNKLQVDGQGHAHVRVPFTFSIKSSAPVSTLPNRRLRTCILMKMGWYVFPANKQSLYPTISEFQNSHPDNNLFTSATGCILVN